MRLLRALGGVLLWLLACVLGLVSVLLCITLILLPLGIPLLRLTRRLFTAAIRLMLPRAVAHPVGETRRRLGKVKDQATANAEKSASRFAKRTRKAGRRARKKIR